MPARNILVINCGSSSIKFALVNEAQATFPLQGLAECIGTAEAVIHFESAAGKESVKVPNADHQAALAHHAPVFLTQYGAAPGGEYDPGMAGMLIDDAGLALTEPGLAFEVEDHWYPHAATLFDFMIGVHEAARQCARQAAAYGGLARARHAHEYDGQRQGRLRRLGQDVAGHIGKRNVR